MKIGILDSGVGGLTVMKAVMERLPQISITYFGDTARLPYGDKSPAIINRYARAGAEFLATKNISLLVIACNTAAACCYGALRNHLPFPIIDVIAPSAEAASRLSRNGKIAVLGTRTTVRSQCYQKMIRSLRPDADIIAVACPLFVPLVEEQMACHPAATLIIKEYLSPLIKARIDTVILGCTHYPLLRASIAAELGENVHIIDSASCCADSTCDLVSDRISSVVPNISVPSLIPSYQFFVSDDAERFRDLIATFLPALSFHHVDVALAEM